MKCTIIHNAQIQIVNHTEFKLRTQLMETRQKPSTSQSTLPRSADWRWRGASMRQQSLLAWTNTMAYFSHLPSTWNLQPPGSHVCRALQIHHTVKTTSSACANGPDPSTPRERNFQIWNTHSKTGELTPWHHASPRRPKKHDKRQKWWMWHTGCEGGWNIYVIKEKINDHQTLIKSYI